MLLRAHSETLSRFANQFWSDLSAEAA
jgi:hypothetical protein